LSYGSKNRLADSPYLRDNGLALRAYYRTNTTHYRVKLQQNLTSGFQVTGNLLT